MGPRGAVLGAEGAAVGGDLSGASERASGVGWIGSLDLTCVGLFGYQDTAQGPVFVRTTAQFLMRGRRAVSAHGKFEKQMHIWGL
jgi:hypothetical protein